MYNINEDKKHIEKGDIMNERIIVAIMDNGQMVVGQQQTGQKNFLQFPCLVWSDQEGKIQARSFFGKPTAIDANMEKVMFTYELLDPKIKESYLTLIQTEFAEKKEESKIVAPTPGKIFVVPNKEF